jgi:hypothetical protein
VSERTADDPGRTLRVQLDVQLDRRPICGRLRTAWGGDEPFEGWLGFVEALWRLHEGAPPGASDPDAGADAGGGDDADRDGRPRRPAEGAP